MNIVLTNDAKTLAGGENYVLFLAQGLTERGHKVIIAPLSDSGLADKSREMNFDTIEIPYSAKGKEFKCVRLLTKKLANRNIDIIHTNTNFDRTIGAVVAKMIGCKCVASVHSCFSIRRNLTHWYRNKYLIHHFTPDGHSAKELLINKDKIPKEKVTVVHIGIPDVDRSKYDQIRPASRREFDIKQNEIVIGAVSRLVEFKGITYLLKAAKILMDQNKTCKTIIVGSGELYDNLVGEAEELGINNKVIFTGYRSDLERLYPAFDIYVQPSKDFGGETFPISVLNALSFGLPIAASDVGDIRYQIKDGYNGFLLKPENVEELTLKLNLLISNDNLRRTMGENSVKYFQDNFTLDKMISKMENIYKLLLGE